TYGAAAGINYPLTPSLYLNIRGNFLPGLSNEYFILNESRKINNTTLDLFDLKRSTTDLVRWDFGVTWRFTGDDD
ncbi:MAG: hypothetical protein WAT46_12535, partial [Saprospiraceae bacterium]